MFNYDEFRQDFLNSKFGIWFLFQPLNSLVRFPYMAKSKPENHHIDTIYLLNRQLFVANHFHFATKICNKMFVPSQSRFVAWSQISWIVVAMTTSTTAFYLKHWTNIISKCIEVEISNILYVIFFQFYFASKVIRFVNTKINTKIEFLNLYFVEIILKWLA